ncbi:OLC1v1010424C1 [Oldenlandia corymbosa var. corymbosa]|uniref:OLC1v1010424C1 n=1 Tax=Oldenlandia corymbosa var. corymbosa TaxID=529605 RepID=A0AAV1DUP4_OLDCO|nr:OLC1v1010424C1 [Oldenlandia corymbosa var. corymbosa]
MEGIFCGGPNFFGEGSETISGFDAGGLSTGRCDSIVKVIRALENVRFLRLDGISMQALYGGTSPLFVKFSKLTKLDIECHCCQWRSLPVMLGCSAVLEVLKIRKVKCVSDGSIQCDCWDEPKEVPECLSNSLATMSFTGFEGIDSEMKMVKYISKHGAVMRTIELESAPDRVASNTKFQTLWRISMFPRFSPTCKIQFDGVDVSKAL